jgi:tetratricopeptide (TPR) repeat protein
VGVSRAVLQQALQIKVEYKDRYSQANTYGQLGRVAQKQRKWKEAELWFQRALQIFLEYKDHYAQANTYHNLGIVAQEQRKWEEAERYLQQALQIFLEYKDRYSQANTYGQLGRVAQEQRKWEQARAYYLQALEIFTAYKDDYSINIVLYNMALLWQASGDATLPAAIAPTLNATPDEVEAALRELLEDEDGG